MKEDLCKMFHGVMKNKRFSFIQTAKVSGMSKTQVNNIVNHRGREVSIEKILEGLQNLGYKVIISVEGEEL